MTTDDDTSTGSTPDDRHRERFLAAIDEAVRDGEWTRAATLIDSHWQSFVGSEPQVLLDVILALPTAVYRERPRLEHAANYLEHLVSGRDPRRFHDHARTRKNPTLFDHLVALTSRTAGDRTGGRLAAARGRAREALRLLEGASDQDRAELRGSLPDLLLQWGRSLEVAGSGEEIRPYEEAYELAQLLGNTRIERRAAACLAWTMAWQGQLHSAEDWVRRARQAGAANPRYDAPLHLATALIHADRFEWDDARSALAESAQLSLGEYWAAALFVRSHMAETPAEVMVIEGDVDLEQRRQPDGLISGGANASYLAMARLRMDRIKGMPPTRIAGPAVVQHLQRSLRAIAVGDFHAAVDQATTLVGARIPPRVRAIGLLLVAAACARLGRHRSSRTALTEAHTLIDRDKLYSTYSVLPAEEVLPLIHTAAIRLDAAIIAELRRSRGDAGIADSPLSRREREVLQLLTTELSMSEIAQTLFVSVNTVKSTTRRLYRKLGVSSRAEAADFAGGPSILS